MTHISFSTRKMKLCILEISLFFWLSIIRISQASSPNSFYKCLSTSEPRLVQTPISDTLIISRNKAQFTTLLNSTAQNLRYLLSSAPKPDLIFTPLTESHVQAAVICAKKLNLHFRVRSGGHDYEANSYVSQLNSPFIVIDFCKLRQVKVNPKTKTVWAQAGATVGEVYYRVSQKSRLLGFPAGICTSLGVGGHITGGAYGFLMRKYGLGADNAIDARIVDNRGNILNRKSMGEDVFWAIRGGGGNNFGIILSWKLKLVPVPYNMTVFTVPRTLEQGASKLVYKWQEVANKMDDDVFMRVVFQADDSMNGKRTVIALFNCVFAGDKERLLSILSKWFPELGVKRGDCSEMSWIDAVMYTSSFPAGTSREVLLTGRAAFRNAFKAKSDFVAKAIPVSGLEGMWKRLLKEETPLMIWNPYGGAMSRISESSIAFPHRKEVMYMIQYVTTWLDSSPESVDKHCGWIRELYGYMGAYVSKDPRRAYLNYRDLDLGTDQGSNSSWASHYYKDNFKRLVQIKGAVDPHNFFHHEQSIPTSLTN